MDIETIDSISEVLQIDETLHFAKESAIRELSHEKSSKDPGVLLLCMVATALRLYEK